MKEGEPQGSEPQRSEKPEPSGAGQRGGDEVGEYENRLVASVQGDREYVSSSLNEPFDGLDDVLTDPWADLVVFLDRFGDDVVGRRIGEESGGMGKADSRAERERPEHS